MTETIIKTWSRISRVICYPTETSTIFFCEVHHTTNEGSTLDGFQVNSIRAEDSTSTTLWSYDKGEDDVDEFGIIENTLAINYNDKNGYCKLEKTIMGDEVLTAAVCSKEPTMREWLK
ncbi:hypothetical protein LCGC14_0223300 [marine sediment metagenome]|uniref:Uncharacterized protein n=1 Tax=marine sediment metagenome TaxID=412755 RepID=A0A0F9UTB3_9ZZZZ|nr:hypothetical protein [bacterium]